MTTNSILDRWFVGKLGPNALAAVGVGGQVLFILVSVSMAISVGTTALVARFTGAREPGDVDRAAGQSLALGAGAGVILTLGLYLGLDGLLSAMGVGEQANIECRRFLHIALLGTVPMVLVNVIASAFRGLGDTRTPMKVMVCANLVHIMGDYCFMLGGLGAPRLGLAGGGVAVASSNLTAYIVYTWLLARSPLRGALRPASLRLSIAWAARILRIGWPAALTALLRNTSLMAFTGILARTAEKTLAVAALPIGLAAESLAFMPGFGFSVAASALVGQSLGARDPDRAQAAGWAAAQQGAVIMSIMGAVFFVAAEPFTRMFTHDPVVVRISISYLRIMAISEPALAFGMILTGGLQGCLLYTSPSPRD